MDCTTPTSRSRRYRVIQTVNRLDPAINEVLTESDLAHFRGNEPGCTVEVVPNQRKR
jgi:hypothetical protein